MALEQRGAQLVGFVCRTEQGTRQAEHLLGRPATGGLASLVSAQPSAIFLTVPDDALCRVVQELAAHLGCTHPLPAGIVVHTSGATSVRVLAPCAAVGWSALAFHPLQTFPSLLPEGTPGEAELQTPLSSAQQAALAAEASKRFLGIGVAVTPFPDQAETARDWGINLAAALGAKPFFLSDDKRPLYHAAASLACNYLVTLEGLAEELFVAAGMPPEEARQLFLPLVRTTLENLAKQGPVAALTGPARRGDRQTIAAHIRALQAQVPDLLPFYGELGLVTLALVRQAGDVDEAAIQEVERLFNECITSRNTPKQE